VRTIQEYKGYEIIERYNKPYVRFFGGREEDMICEFPITEEQANKAIENPSLIDEYIEQEKKLVIWNAESFYEIGICEYIVNCLGKSQEYAKEAYEQISKYKEIRNEFYKYIMDEKYKKVITINGNNFSDLEGFYGEIDKLLTKDLNWKTGHNFDAFEDILKGGFGVHEDGEPIVIKWINYEKSKKDLGNDTMLLLLEIICDFKNTGHKCKLELYP